MQSINARLQSAEISASLAVPYRAPAARAQNQPPAQCDTTSAAIVEDATVAIGANLA
jgi:hypothetical protein